MLKFALPCGYKILSHVHIAGFILLALKPLANPFEDGLDTVEQSVVAKARDALIHYLLSHSIDLSTNLKLHYRLVGEVINSNSALVLSN